MCMADSTQPPATSLAKQVLLMRNMIHWVAFIHGIVCSAAASACHCCLQDTVLVHVCVQVLVVAQKPPACHLHVD